MMMMMGGSAGHLLGSPAWTEALWVLGSLAAACLVMIGVGLGLLWWDSRPRGGPSSRGPRGG